MEKKLKENYRKKTSEAELNSLNNLAELPNYLFLANVLNTNIEDYRAEYITQIEQQITELSAQVTKLNTELTLNKAKLKRMVSNRNISNELFVAGSKGSVLDEAEQEHVLSTITSSKLRAELELKIKSIQKQINDAETKIHNLQAKKVLIMELDERSLKDKFISENRESTRKFKRIYQTVISRKDRAYHSLMQTEEGYAYLVDKLSELEKLKKLRKNAKATITFSFDWPENVLTYLKNSFQANNFQIEGNIAELENVKKSLKSIISYLISLKQKMMYYSPRKYTELLSDAQDTIAKAAIIKANFNIDVEDLCYPRYYNLTLAFDDFYDSYLILKRKSRISKTAREAFVLRKDKLSINSEEIVDLIRSYIITLYRKAIAELGLTFDINTEDIKVLSDNYDIYMKEIDEFISSLQAFIMKIDVGINILQKHTDLLDNEMSNVITDISNRANMPLLGIDNPSILDDIFASYQKVYTENLAKSIEDEVTFRFMSKYKKVPTHYTYKKIPKYQK